MKNTQAYLDVCLQTFLYDPETASFLRRRVNHRESSKTPSSPYRMVDIYVDGKRYSEYVHRVVWMIHNGLIPEDKVVDHIDRNKLNNSIDNLRLVTKSENFLNSDTSPSRGTRPKGRRTVSITWHKSFKKWSVSIVKNGEVLKHLGYVAHKGDVHELLREYRKGNNT